jgi:solute carrier family 40 (iron-regulated transporter), member 1
MLKTSLSFRMLCGRLLTRSGDQAWDFAVPIVLLQIFPGNLRIAALYYLHVRIATVLTLPHLAQTIDHINRWKAARLGIFIQLIGVIGGFLSVYTVLQALNHGFGSIEFIIAFVALVISGVVSQLGSSFMEISVANDLAPSTFEGQELSKFNSRLRQVDLFTEVVSPVLAGSILLFSTADHPLCGFGLIAFWNVASFLPEYGILKSVFVERPDLSEKPIKIESSVRLSIWFKLHSGWNNFFKQPIAPVMLSYALLWLSVLSPHGVLLTGFLKDGWMLPEWMIGAFRGLGAFFGLLATVIYPIVLKRFSVEKASGFFLLFQTLTLSIGLVLFLLAGDTGQIGFLIMILFSRIGLYGFSLGEMQIRQTKIPTDVRGEVNGFASALTALATIGLFSLGVILPSTNEFKYLVVASVGFVIVSLLVYLNWTRKQI